MELIEAIKTRHSVRKYTDQPIEVSKIATLRKAIEEANAKSGLNIQLVVNEPKAFGSKLHTYGTFSGVRNYLVMAAPKGREWEEKVGYYGEKIVILAQSLGLNTCWAGLTYKKVAGAFTLRDGDTLRLEAALLAPTAVNQQKFKFILRNGNKVETKTFFSPWGYTQIDLGIVKYHFEIGAGKENFQWL